MDNICFICIKNPRNIETIFILNNNIIEKYEMNSVNINYLHKYLSDKVCISFGYSIKILASYNIKSEFINLKNMYKDKLNLLQEQKINRWEMAKGLNIDLESLTNKNKYETGTITCNIYKSIYDKLKLI